MILHARKQKHGKRGLPWLMFLHGFLAITGQKMANGRACRLPRLYVDLPQVVTSMDLMCHRLINKETLVKTTYLTSGWWVLSDGK